MPDPYDIARKLREHQCGCGGACGQQTPAYLAEAAALLDEMERLRAALQPFADTAAVVAAVHPGWDHDDFRIGGALSHLTMRPFRAARAALSPTGNRHQE